MIDNHQKNIATCIHLSTFSRFIFPFGNFIAPVILWITNKDKSQFIDVHGKEAINFQLSILLYTVIIGLITVPFFIFNIFNGLDFINFNLLEHIEINISKPSPLLYLGGALAGLAVLGFIIELALIVNASLKAKDGELFRYPLNIHFIK
ncbi:conserved hypothetical protein, Tic20-like famil y [Formosa agariphila KMM 3901]|uniref:DUF4870 domain-containing protein n=1 Tax=Formosa agariphila (strain DSM 15362 / KCTC 12365 / LMG 23005 / KMM 3901 / M-2Alg 35-1) TaxID=1347342 RepID=T2KLF6_FORAG|nr:DUF4870 domain-containing protein [Formosa agariphila]CDF79737.1 conserved hypothetical protein, Tic20-like famil y [Formosa agariphila KMM 3901]